MESKHQKPRPRISLNPKLTKYGGRKSKSCASYSFGGVLASPNLETLRLDPDPETPKFKETRGGEFRVYRAPIRLLQGQLLT